MAKTKAKRLGRPPTTLSDETPARILVAARRCFAVNGFDIRLRIVPA